jgi:hypothetical protein
MRTITVGLPVPESARGKHRWQFFQAAGLRQTRLLAGDDFVHLDQLPQELWTILSCPTQGVRFNARTLALLDSDRDGRIRVQEMLAGVRWTCRRLRNPAVLLEDAPRLRLADLAETPEGRALEVIARRVLADIGQSGREAITLDDVAAREQWLAKTPFNGDGIVTPDSAETPEQRQLLAEMVAAFGGVRDRCGTMGVDQAQLDQFFAEARACAAWFDTGEREQAVVLPLGDATAAACASVRAVRVKIDDYFMRCRLAAFDPRAVNPLNRGESDYGALATLDLHAGRDEIAAFPLAQAGADRPLPLGAGLNPYWVAAMADFVRQALNPLLGEGSAELTDAAWRQVQAKLAPHEAWMAAKPDSAVLRLGSARLREILAGEGQALIGALLQKDRACATETGQLADLERLILFHTHLNRLLHNYVNFSDFYDSDREEIFRVGRLYIDGRLCKLCVDVKDINSHATLAAAGKIFLAYCEITRPITQEKRAICVAVTSGFAASLWVGRNGIFYDRDGNDWEAVILKIVDSPVSLKEAFWSPWIKISTMIGDQIRKLLTAKQDAMLSATAKQIDTTTTTVAEGARPPTPPKLEGAALASSVAAIGIAVGLLGSAVGGLISVISGLPLWKSLTGVLAIFLAVSGPSVVLAYFKLRARDLAPVLNACGWAVNSRIRMTMRLGRAFTIEACLPPGSELELGDAFAESRRGRIWSAIIAACLLVLFLYWRLGWLNAWLPASWDRRPGTAAAACESK